MGAAAAVMGGSAILGAISGSKGSGGGTTTTSSVPWSVQQPYMKAGMAGAQDVWNNRKDTALPGSYFANENFMQGGGNNSLYVLGMDGTHKFGNLEQSGNQMLDGNSPYAQAAQGIASNGLGQRDGSMTDLLSNYARTGQMPGQTGVNQDLSNSFGQAAQGGLGSLASGANLASAVGRQAMDPNAAMNATVNGANRYMNNGVINGQIDAIGTDISRNLNETTLTGIRQAAQQSGATNSSREGALEAIAGRGAHENLANAAANIRGNAYQQGAGLASNQYQMGMNTALGAAGALNSNGATAGSMALGQMGQQMQQGQFGVNSQLSAANGAFGQNLGWQTADAQARLAGNQQVGNATTLGQSALLGGVNGGFTSALAAQQAGTYQQQQDQQGINNNNQMFNAQDTRQQQILNDYWNIVGRPLGTEGSSTAPKVGGGLMGALQGGIGAGVAAYGGVQKVTGNDDPFGFRSGSGRAFDGAGGTAVPGGFG